ncbi:MAG: T9SS type A sorting domain-containing protein, partial [Bacteroidota bacterium]
LYDEQLGELEITILQIQESLGWRDYFTMPMEIKVEFADGTDTIVEVFNNSIFQSFAFNFDDEVINVELDPNDWILKTAQYDPNIIVEIKEAQELILNVYPNPNNGSFSVNISASELDSDIYLSICDLNMRVQYESVINLQYYNTSKPRISNLKRGIYFLNIITNNAKYSQKVVVLN